MTLVQLRALLAVAQHNGFTAAARALRSSQTTLTTQIQALEDEHSVELFHRRGRRIQLTDVGAEFMQLARQMVSHHSRGACQRAPADARTRLDHTPRAGGWICPAWPEA
jgi:LysR family transcriptional regulator, low CO2-responsive transcriptional regulator